MTILASLFGRLGSGKSVALGLLLATCLQASASDHTWQQVSDFPALGLHASGNTVVAWNLLQYAISTDGGVSWSNPIAPTPAGQNPEPVSRAVASPQGALILTSTGKVLSAAVTGATVFPVPAVTNLVVDGMGRVYGEGIDGTVTVLPGGPVAKGRIYRAVQDGVLVQTGRDGLVLASPTGTKPAPFKGEKLPAAFDLAPLTTAGGDRWTTTRGTTWMLKDGKVMAFGERDAQPKAYGFGTDGYHELLGFRGLQITYLQGNTGLAGHWRTKDLPQDATVLTVAGPNFVVANQRGIYFVPIARE